tara:strand:+ start:86 stop:2437 length:2352 start_codon:yes stop_codon:yes gene_type:complete
MNKIIIPLIFFVSTLTAKEISFNRDVRPILSSKCFFCHGPDKKSRKADLRLDLSEEAFKNKDGISAFVKNSLNDSEAWHRINSKNQDDIMPPPEFKKELTDDEINIIKKWIETGAEWQEHWSYLPIKKPKNDARSSWIRNNIDKFILSKLEEQGLKPSPEASKRTLIRRLYLDLTGLPPTVKDINDFIYNDSPHAYEHLVDKLLASESYAERMTLIWMDAARYGDTSVFHDDGPRTMWPWRDWVLNAYKNNMPFNQFTVEQLAGDLLPNATLSQKIASGFNRNHATTDEGGVIPEEFRVEYVVDRVKTTGNVWMGLTMECAQCHDHKYDPISQEEYYQFYAFYNNNADPGMQTRNGNTAPMLEIYPDHPKRRVDLDKQIKVETKILVNNLFVDAVAVGKAGRKRQKLKKELDELNKLKTTSMIMGDNTSDKMRKTYVLMRGQYASPDKSKEILPDTPKFLPPMKKDLPKNRLGLAKWLVDKNNPLTARVTVNRHWQTIFGKALVSTPGDFGSQGAWPSNMDLLNYLASNFIENDFNVKKSIKQMVMSATYRQSSVTIPIHVKKDPTNLYYARAPRFRLLGEFIRDNALFVSGLLSNKVGGPSVKPYQPEGLWNEVSLNGNRRFVQDEGEKLYRKSMYIYWKRSAPHPGMLAFDAPTRETCIIQRQNTNTPMQALVTLNDKQFIEAARVFARNVLQSNNKSFYSKLNFAFESLTGKPTDQLRRRLFEGLYDSQKKIFQSEPQRATELLSIGETKFNDSINPIEHATWTILISTIFNLDETLNRE